MSLFNTKRIVLIIAVAAILAMPVVSVSAGRSEFGIALPISTSFSFGSIGYGLEAYYRLAGAILAWETALKTSTSFSSLYVRNTVSTAAALYLCFGHVTNLLPYFGSTYFTAGVGLGIGQAVVARVTLNIGMSVGGGSVYFFPEIRFQIGLDP